MYQYTTPGNMDNVVTSIQAFCDNAGFTTTLVSGTMLTPGQVTVGLGLHNNLNYLMCDSYRNGVNMARDIAINTTTLTVKDPGSSQTISLIFYTYGNISRRGVVQAGWYMDYRLNDKNLCSLYSLPGSVEGLDMFSGTTSDGKKWAHFAIEEAPQVYIHFGIGVLEKFLSFTGGDYVTAPYYGTYHVSGGVTFFPYSSRTAGNFWFTPAFYCPDLDSANKSNAANDYRSLIYTTLYQRTDFEPGHTSLKINFDANNTRPEGPLTTYEAASGGEIAISNFPLPNVWSGNSPLFPILVYANNGQNLTYSGACGYFKGVRAVNVGNYLPRDEIVLGSDIWVTYPIVAKQGILANQYSTYNQGFAVLKNG